MTLAVIVATAADGEGASTAALKLTGTRVFDRLRGQLASLSTGDVRTLVRRKHVDAFADPADQVVASDDLAGDLREIARMARDAREPVAVCAGDVVAHREALAGLLAAPGDATGALVSVGEPPDDTPDDTPAVRIEHGRVISASSAYHRVTGANGMFRGVLRVRAADAPRLAEIADRFAELAEQYGDEAGARLGGAVELLLVGLVRAGTHVAARDVRELFAGRVHGAQTVRVAEARLAAVDEDAVRLASAVKGDDGFFTTYCVSTYSRYIARWAAHRGMSPNTVTFVNMVVAILAALGFASGTRLGMIAGAVLLYFAFVLDCVDGQLARYARKFSTLGAWLDATGDRAKEYIAYAGLAVGSTAAGFGDVWGLAAAALILQTVRHMIDFSYAAARTGEVATLPPRAPDERDDGLRDHVAAAALPRSPAGGGPRRRGAGIGRSVVGLSRAFDRSRALRWAKKIIVLPIGERFALICVLAAVGTPRVTFLALLVWGGVAACYTLAGRVFRSLS